MLDDIRHVSVDGTGKYITFSVFFREVHQPFFHRSAEDSSKACNPIVEVV